ncbi:DNA sulfur modification protein DndB [Photobacterium damselae]|uniref:DNA sulfur modification protein DndB n=1 Tax=Photobacterium damselae TaxID=38293 RepID=UPI0040686E5B
MKDTGNHAYSKKDIKMSYKIEFPAVKGEQAGRAYYMATVPFSVLGRLLQLDTAGGVLERSQREVNETRANKVKKYILENPTAYIIPSLTGVINVDDIADIDRATGIIQSIKDNSSLKNELVPIMLFTNMSLEERQQAFSDINGTAAKPQQSLSDSYNSRDSLPMLAKHIAMNCSVFNGLIEYERNSITEKSDKLFPIKTIKDASQKFLGITKVDVITEEQKELCVKLWKQIGKELNWSIDDITSIGLDVKQIRTDTIKTHTIMINALALAVSCVIKSIDFDEIDFSKLQMLDFKRDSSDFLDRCVDSKNGSMITNSTALKLTANKVIVCLGGTLNDEQIAIEDKYFINSQCYLDSELQNPLCSEFKKLFYDRSRDKLQEYAQILTESLDSNDIVIYKNAEMTALNDEVMKFFSDVVATDERVFMWKNKEFVNSRVRDYFNM